MENQARVGQVVTVATELNDKVLRKDWPMMRDEAFEHAIRLAAFVGRAMQGNDPQEGDVDVKAVNPQKQYFISFVALRRAIPRSVMLSLSVVGPKLWDFMNVITEVSGLSVVHVNDGLWFFDMRNRQAGNGGYSHRQFKEHYATITLDTVIPQFNPEEADDNSGW